MPLKIHSRSIPKITGAVMLGAPVIIAMEKVVINVDLAVLWADNKRVTAPQIVVGNQPLLVRAKHSV